MVFHSFEKKEKRKEKKKRGVYKPEREREAEKGQLATRPPFYA